MYKNLQLNKFYPIISEQAFVEKWVMYNNQEEYRGNIMNYLEGQLKIFKSIFWNDENKNNKKNENKENNKKNKQCSSFLKFLNYNYKKYDSNKYDKINFYIYILKYKLFCLLKIKLIYIIY